MSIVRCSSIDQQKERIMKNKKLVFLSTCAAVLSLTACGNKAESNVVETATPAPTATASPAPTATPIPENHDIDTAIDTYKNENAIEINPDDIGTDISDIDSLHDWLYNNGVTRESVQNDRDSGCKNPYLEGYLEYLDNLDKPSEAPSKSLDDYEVAEDGEVIIDDWSSLVGGGSDSDVQSGFDGIEDGGQDLHDAVKSGEAQRTLDEMKSRHPDWTI